jgi:large subunit ribosomal protein L15
VGRGESSGHGKTSSRGLNGQNSRSGAGGRVRFEGGQTPLIRRLPKFGFRSFKRVIEDVAIINLGQLNDFSPDSEVNLQALVGKGLIAKRSKKVRVLAKGSLKHPLKIKADYFSKTALESIAQAKGVAEKVS